MVVAGKQDTEKHARLTEKDHEVCMDSWMTVVKEEELKHKEEALKASSEETAKTTIKSDSSTKS